MLVVIRTVPGESGSSKDSAAPIPLLSGRKPDRAGVLELQVPTAVGARRLPVLIANDWDRTEGLRRAIATHQIDRREAGHRRIAVG